MIRYKKKFILICSSILLFLILCGTFVYNYYQYNRNYNTDKIIQEIDQLQIENKLLNKTIKKSIESKKLIIDHLIDPEKLEKNVQNFQKVVGITSLLLIKNHSILMDEKYVNKVDIIMIYESDSFLNQKIKKRLFTKIAHASFDMKEIDIELTKNKLILHMVK